MARQPTATEILNTALKTVHEEYGLRATADDTAKSIGLDSLDEVDLILSLEDQLEVEFDDKLEEALKPDQTLRQWAEESVKHLVP